MTLRLLGLLALVAALIAPASRAAACGADSDCAVAANGRALGVYRIWRPETAAAAPIGAIVFLHGWRATAAGVMRNAAMVDMARRLGVALVAPQSRGETWAYPGSPSRERDEFAFFEALRQELIATQSVDPDRILVGGFSMGGSMAWYLACRMGDRYLGFAPAAGAFWGPLPERCPHPARYLIHTHGTTDGVVPIEGRPLGGGYSQGDAWESFDVLTGGLGLTESADAEDARGMRCRRWTGAQRLLEFCRHGGGHMSKPAWVERAWRLITERTDG